MRSTESLHAIVNSITQVVESGDHLKIGIVLGQVICELKSIIKQIENETDRIPEGINGTATRKRNQCDNIF